MHPSRLRQTEDGPTGWILTAISEKNHRQGERPFGLYVGGGKCLNCETGRSEVYTHLWESDSKLRIQNSQANRP